MSTRIYKVTVVGETAAKNKEFLINTISPKRAQQVVGRKFINAKLASGADVAELMGRGVKVEDGNTPDPEPNPQQTSLETAE